MAPTNVIPTSVQPWGPSGPVILMPGHASFVAGTDVSLPLNWWLSRGIGIGSDGASLGSGTSSANRGRVVAQPDTEYIIEEGIRFGAKTPTGPTDPYIDEHDVAWVWPNYPAHFWRHLVWDLNGSVFWQKDDTNYETGVRSRNVNATLESTTAVLTAALSVDDVARYNDPVMGGASIQSINTAKPAIARTVPTLTAGSTTIPLNPAITGVNIIARMLAGGTVQTQSGLLFPGGTYGTPITGIDPAGGHYLTVAAGKGATGSGTSVPITIYLPAGRLFVGGTKGTDILAIAPDRKTLTIADPAYRDSLLNEDCSVFLTPIRPDRQDGVQLVHVNGPGSWAGVERAGMAHDIVITNGIIRGSNADDVSGITGKREGWSAIIPRQIDTMLVENDVVIEHVWADGLNTGPSSQVGLTDVDVDCEYITFRAILNGIGRHPYTLQGAYRCVMDGAILKNATRLTCDVEPTDADARALGCGFRNSVLTAGTALFHTSPVALLAEPPRIVEGVTTVDGSNRITYATEHLESADRGAYIDHPNLPAGTWLGRRMSPTEFEVSANATAAGIADAIVGGACLFRDWFVENCAMWGTPGNLAGNTSPPRGKAYFTFDVVAGSDTITNIEWEDRPDGLVFSTDDIGANKVYWGQTSIFSGAGAVPTAHTATTLKFAGLSAARSTNSGRTIGGSTVAGSRIFAANLSVFVNSSDKNMTLDGPGLRPGTVIRSAGGKGATLSQPASADGSATFTEGGKVRAYVLLVDNDWGPWTIDELRNVSTTSKWNGNGIAETPANQPLVALPPRSGPVTITRNMLVGARNGAGAVVRYLAGTFNTGIAGVTFGVPAGRTDWTIEDNLGIDMLDNQMADPTVTCALVMSVDDIHSATPTYTIVATFSDARIAVGKAIVITRDGQDHGACLLDETNTATYRYTDLSQQVPLPDGRYAIQARWGNGVFGSHDTRAAVSNTITQSVGPVVPTATTLTLGASPASPTDAGTTVTLTATVSPDPGPAVVTFAVDGTPVGTGTLASGACTLPVTFAAGVHTVTASWAGNVDYLADSDSISYTAAVVVVPDTTPPTIIDSVPFDGEDNVERHTTITLTFSETVTGVVAGVYTDDNPRQLVPSVLSGTGAERTLTPIAPLDWDATFVVIVDDAVDAAEPAGNHLAGRVTLQFTTRPNVHGISGKVRFTSLTGTRT